MPRNATYDNDDDKEQQRRLMLAFSAHGNATQSEPVYLGTMHFFKEGTPMHDTAANGGPILGWATCPVVMATGCQCHRFYAKDAVEEDITITWMTADKWTELMASIAQDSAAAP